MADGNHVDSCRRRGGAAFARGQHRQAAQLYSEALRYCSEGGSTTRAADSAATADADAALAARLYCNRALCLSQLATPNWSASLSDSAVALACDPTFAKAHFRRACAFRALGRRDEALLSAGRALELLRQQQQVAAGDAAAAEAAALVAQLEGEAAAAAAASMVGGDSDSNGAADGAANGTCCNGPTGVEGEAPSNLAALVRQAGLVRLAVGDTPAAGRCLTAAEALPAGCDVLRERPFAAAPTKQGRRSVSGWVEGFDLRMLLCTGNDFESSPPVPEPPLHCLTRRSAPRALHRWRAPRPPTTAAAARCLPTALPPVATPTHSMRQGDPSAADPGRCCCRQRRWRLCVWRGDGARLALPHQPPPPPPSSRWRPWGRTSLSWRQASAPSWRRWQRLPTSSGRAPRQRQLQLQEEGRTAQGAR